MDNNINISLLEREKDSISEVRIDGVIDTITAGQLEEVMDSLVKRKRYKIVIDLAGVDYISSAGWGILISHIKELRSNQGDIKLAGMMENVYEVYELLEFENVLKSFDSVDEARRDFGTESAIKDSKKKGQQKARVTVIDGLDPGSPNTGKQNIYAANISDSNRDPITNILMLIKRDPFMSIWEIKSMLNKRKTTDFIGWWQLVSILKEQKLLSRRSRFRFARGFYLK